MNCKLYSCNCAQVGRVFKLLPCYYWIDICSSYIMEFMELMHEWLVWKNKPTNIYLVTSDDPPKISSSWRTMVPLSNLRIGNFSCCETNLPDYIAFTSTDSFRSACMRKPSLHRVTRYLSTIFYQFEAIKRCNVRCSWESFRLYEDHRRIKHTVTAQETSFCTILLKVNDSDLSFFWYWRSVSGSSELPLQD
jgi:hypothetical protein